MKISIDITRAGIEGAGIGRFTREMVAALLKVDKENEYSLIATYFRDSKDKENRLKSFQESGCEIHRAHIPGGTKEVLWGMNLPVYDNLYRGADLLLAPSFFEAKMSLKIPQVVVIHDLATFLYPDQRGKEVSDRHNRRVKMVCAKAKEIIAISESTKNDLIKILKIDETKIKVIYPGQTVFPPSGKLPKNITSGKYILFVGTLEPRKNLKNLLQAYEMLSDSLKEEYPLVIVGAKGWNTNAEFEQMKNMKNVIALGYVGDADLGELYKNAAVFAYPSIYEGFGLPVIEAQQFGVPVLTSNTSSLPEAVGDGGVQVDPNNVEAISIGLQKLLVDKELRQLLSVKAKNHAQQFSWEKSAGEMVSLIKSI